MLEVVVDESREWKRKVAKLLPDSAIEKTN